MRRTALVALLALVACSPITDDLRTERGTLVYANGYAVDLDAVDDAQADAEQCLKYVGFVREVHLRATPFEVVMDGEVILADGYVTPKTARVIVGPDLAALRHEVTHVLLYQRDGWKGHNVRPGEAHCYGVAAGR